MIVSYSIGVNRPRAIQPRDPNNPPANYLMAEAAINTCAQANLNTVISDHALNFTVIIKSVAVQPFLDQVETAWAVSIEMVGGPRARHCRMFFLQDWPGLVPAPGANSCG